MLMKLHWKQALSERDISGKKMFLVNIPEIINNFTFLKIYLFNLLQHVKKVIGTTRIRFDYFQKLF